ncbi:MAG TPA: phosphatidylglycerol lysyltransferase domain-containing protein [Candidatus Saccharimonadales bacterium]|nr:phosphatidylglycerol lysyltransferase domain-containing protein [Candidatus Saccharimonadales bacterium]
MKAHRTRLQPWLLRTLTYLVAANGLVLVAATLQDQLQFHMSRHLLHLTTIAFDVPLVLGITLLYLSVLLGRRKHTAWLVTIGVYAIILLVGILRTLALDEFSFFFVLRDVVLPLVLVFGLLLIQDEFTVRSDVRSFAFSLRFIALVLAVMFVYGTAGFILLDTRDFRQELNLVQAMHYTVDQFNITTTHTLVPYTRRAKIFVDSLSTVSTAAVVYAVLSLFQPIRVRLGDQSGERELAASLLHRYHGSSEDFFKLWPEDKLYFFNVQHTAGVAYTVHGGVALLAGDPFGSATAFPALLRSFDDYCRTNDWLLAAVHTEPKYNDLYRHLGLSLQKIGEEAVVDITHFDHEVRTSKYFRQIRNKFEKQAYICELLKPPHNDAVIARLRTISDEWLKQPGRAERGFLLGYFSAEYMQRCNIMVVRDAAGTIQAFINQVPSFDPKEANFDLLRQSSQALGNANDFLLLSFIEYAAAEGFMRINLGLCPLSGLDARDEERSVVDSALRFVYANGDRLYSFSGLHRFKAKYDPVWSSRYIAYRGGIRGFTRTVNALNKALKV